MVLSNLRVELYCKLRYLFSYYQSELMNNCYGKIIAFLPQSKFGEKSERESYPMSYPE